MIYYKSNDKSFYLEYEKIINFVESDHSIVISNLKFINDHKHSNKLKTIWK